MGSFHLPVLFIFVDWTVLFRGDVIVVVWTSFFFLIGSSLRAASVWRKEIEISKGQNKQFSFLLYIRRTITLLY